MHAKVKHLHIDICVVWKLTHGSQWDWKNWRAFSSHEKSRNFDKTGKSGKNQAILPEILENREILILAKWQNTGKVRKICQPEKIKIWEYGAKL